MSKDKQLVLNRQFKAKSKNQAEYIRAIAESEIIYCVGPAGTGKTAVAVAIAMDYLSRGVVSKIVITRPAVGADTEGDKGLGFLPGDIRDKMDPYLRPIFDELATYLPKSLIEALIADEVIEIAPLHYMRGRTFHDTFVVVDEAQNMTYKQIKMVTTRMGSRSKMVINGDLDQSDLPRSVGCPLHTVVYDVIGLNNEHIPVCIMDKGDIVRSRIVEIVLNLFEKYEIK